MQLLWSDRRHNEAARRRNLMLELLLIVVCCALLDHLIFGRTKLASLPPTEQKILKYVTRHPHRPYPLASGMSIWLELPESDIRAALNSLLEKKLLKRRSFMPYEDWYYSPTWRGQRTVEPIIGPATT